MSILRKHHFLNNCKIIWPQNKRVNLSWTELYLFSSRIWLMSADITVYACMCHLQRKTLNNTPKVFIHPRFDMHWIYKRNSCIRFSRGKLDAISKRAPVLSDQTFDHLTTIHEGEKALHDTQGRQRGLQWSYIIRDRGLRPVHLHVQRFYSYDIYFKLCEGGSTHHFITLWIHIHRIWDRYRL